MQLNELREFDARLICSVFMLSRLHGEPFRFFVDDGDDAILLSENRPMQIAFNLIRDIEFLHRDIDEALYFRVE